MDDASRPDRAPREELLPTRPSLLARLRNEADHSSWKRGWQEFFDLYSPLLYDRARRRGLSEADAEDVVAEILAGVVNRLPGFSCRSEQDSFKAWLITVARNKINDHLRRRRRQLPESDDEAAMAAVADDSMPPPDQAWDQAWDRAFEANLLRAARERVKQSVAGQTLRLYLHHVVDGHSVAETVAYFSDAGVTAAAVYLAKSRGLALMEEELQQLRRKLPPHETD